MDYFNQKKYLEFKVLEWDAKAGVPKRKEPTEKGSAVISEKDAYTLNAMAEARKVWYELEPEPVAEPKPAKPAK